MEAQQKKKMEDTFEELIEYIMGDETGSLIKDRFRREFKNVHFYLEIKKNKSKYTLVKHGHFEVNDRLLRFIIYTLYKNEVEYAEDKIQYPTFNSVAEFVAFINNYISHIGYISLILTSAPTKGGIGGEIDILLMTKGKILSHIDYYGNEEGPKSRYKGKYTLLSIDSSTLDKRSAGNCVGGGHCYTYYNINSPKEKFKKGDRIIVEVDGEFVVDTTIDDFVKNAGQSLGESDVWTIGLDETGDDDSFDDEEKSWRETKEHIYVNNFLLTQHERYR